MEVHTITDNELYDRAMFFAKNILHIETDYLTDVVFMSGYDAYGNEIPVLGAFRYNGESYLGDNDEDDCIECWIEINDTLATQPLLLNNALLHELIHYKLWYLGYEYHDKDKQFLDELKKYHITSNFDGEFDKKTKQWQDAIDEEQMQIYETMFRNGSCILDYENFAL